MTSPRRTRHTMSGTRLVDSSPVSASRVSGGGDDQSRESYRRARHARGTDEVLPLRARGLERGVQHEVRRIVHVGRARRARQLNAVVTAVAERVERARSPRVGIAAVAVCVRRADGLLGRRAWVRQELDGHARAVGREGRGANGPLDVEGVDAAGVPNGWVLEIAHRCW